MRVLPVAFACLFGLLSAVAPAMAKPAKRSAAGDGGAAAMVSQYRAAHGLGPVRSDPVLTRAAQQQAQAMAAAGVMSHDVGGSFSSRLAASGIGVSSAAENVAAGQRSLREAMASWQASSGHSANLLLSGATRMGIARVDAPGKPYGVYWAMIIAGEGSSGRSASGFGVVPLPFGIGFFVGH